MSKNWLPEFDCWSYYKKLCHNAAGRGHPVEIVPNDLVKQWNKQNGKCALTGLDLELYAARRRGKNPGASIDRIDNNRGYVLGNIQWVHKNVNRMKSTLDQAEFIRMCRLIAERNQDG